MKTAAPPQLCVCRVPLFSCSLTPHQPRANSQPLRAPHLQNFGGGQPKQGNLELLCLIPAPTFKKHHHHKSTDIQFHSQHTDRNEERGTKENSKRK